MFFLTNFDFFLGKAETGWILRIDGWFSKKNSKVEKSWVRNSKTNDQNAAVDGLMKLADGICFASPVKMSDNLLSPDLKTARGFENCGFAVMCEIHQHVDLFQPVFISRNA